MRKIKRLIKKHLTRTLRKLGFLAHTHRGLVDAGTQIQLRLKYQELLHKKLPLPSFRDIEFRSYSQNSEDGILLYLFSIIGETNRKVVELCCGNAIECNAANLIINHGWEGFLFDGNPDLLQEGKDFYENHPSTFSWPPKLIQGWIEKDNINSLISPHVTGEIDLLSLDMDGVDWWIWEALEVISPRIIICEYNNVLGPELSLTVPYKADFSAEKDSHGISYCGASLTAFNKLAQRKGYRLVGTEKYGFNAFFIRNDIAQDILPAIEPTQCFSHSFAKYAHQIRYQKVKDKEWVKV